MNGPRTTNDILAAHPQSQSDNDPHGRLNVLVGELPRAPDHSRVRVLTLPRPIGVVETFCRRVSI